MNIHHCVFKILEKTKVSRTDGHTDGRTDRQTDGRTDNVKTVYPTTNKVLLQTPTGTILTMEESVIGLEVKSLYVIVRIVCNIYSFVPSHLKKCYEPILKGGGPQKYK